MSGPNANGAVAPYHDRDEWLEVHKTGLGGSDAAAVVGLDPNRSRIDVFDEKMGLKDDLPPNSDQRRGLKQEAIAAEKYVEVTGRQIRRQPLRRHPEHDWMICDIDRQVMLDERGPGLAELKVPRIPNFYKIRDEGLPEQHIVQLHHNMIVWGYEWSSFALYTPEYDDLIHFDVALDPDVAEKLVAVEESFWYSYIAPKERPSRERPIIDLPPIPKVAGEAELRMDSEWAEAAEKMIKADADKGWAEAEYEEAKARLIELASGGDEQAAFFASGCGVSIRRDWRDGRRTIDPRAIKAFYPDIELEKIQKVGKPYAQVKLTVTAPETAIEGVA